MTTDDTNAQFIDKLSNADGLFIIVENGLETEQIPCQIIYEDSVESSEPFYALVNNGYDGMIEALYLNDIKVAKIIYKADTKTYIYKPNTEDELELRFFYVG